MSASPAASFPRIKLAHWLYASVVLIVLATALPVSMVIRQFAHEQLARQSAESLQQIAWQMRDALDRGMSERYEEILRSSSGTLFKQRPLDVPRARQALEHLQESFPYYAWLGLTDLDGKIVVDTGGLLQGVDVSQRPWFAGALAGPYVGDVHAAVLLAKKLPTQNDPWRFVDIAMPVKDDSGKVIGVLAAHLSWNWARELQENLIDRGLRTYQTEIWIAQRDGTVLLGPRQDDTKKIPAAAFTQDLVTWENGQSYLSRHVVSTGHRRYPGLGWVVLVRQPESVAYAEIEQLQSRILVVRICVVILMLIAAGLIARHLSRPLTTLSEAIERRAKGEPDAPLPIARTYHEASVLAHAFKQFDAAERAHIAELDQRVEERAVALHEANEMLLRLMQDQQTAQAVVAESEALMRAILANANDAYVRIDASGYITEWNATAERLFGWSRDEALGQSLTETIIPAVYREAHAQGFARFLQTGEGPVINRRIEITALRRDGSEFPIELTVGAVKRGEEWVISGFMHDISERKAASAALEESRTRLKTITDNLPVLIAYVDRDLVYRFNNAAYREIMDRDPNTLTGRSLTELFGDETLNQISPYVQRALAGETVSFDRHQTTRGETRLVHTTYVPDIEHGSNPPKVLGFHVLGIDITHQRRLEESLVKQALEDTLTGLPNRRALLERLPQAMARANRTQKPLGVLFLDLDGFKKINDSLGHEAGDELLIQFARRLQACVRTTDTVARLAGDEFTILLETLNGGTEDARGVANKIIAAMAQPFILKGLETTVTTSIGVALYAPRSIMTVDALLHDADAAMYIAKRAGKNQCHVHDASGAGNTARS